MSQFWTRKLPWRTRLRLYVTWPYLRQVGPMYRVSMWWMNRAKCPGCGGPASDNWFDRSLCACGAMHTCCSNCGQALDDCEYEAGEGTR